MSALEVAGIVVLAALPGTVIAVAVWPWIRLLEWWEADLRRRRRESKP